MITAGVFTVVCVTDDRHESRFYVVELAPQTLKFRSSWGPFIYRRQAVSRKRDIMARQKRYLKGSADKSTRSQSRLHHCRTERQQHMVAHRDEYIQDWRDGKFEGPSFFRAHIASSTRLIMRDNDLIDPTAVPVGIWLGRETIKNQRYRPMVICYNEQYRLFAYVGQFSEISLACIHEIRVPLEYTLVI